MSAEMRLDVRWPIGGMFTFIGALLVVYGLVSDQAMYSRSLGININLWWGLVMLIFGILMLALARKTTREARKLAQSTDRKLATGPAK